MPTLTDGCMYLGAAGGAHLELGSLAPQQLPHLRSLFLQARSNQIAPSQPQPEDLCSLPVPFLLCACVCLSAACWEGRQGSGDVLGLQSWALSSYGLMEGTTASSLLPCSFPLPSRPSLPRICLSMFIFCLDVDPRSPYLGMTSGSQGAGAGNLQGSPGMREPG